MHTWVQCSFAFSLPAQYPREAATKLLHIASPLIVSLHALSGNSFFWMTNYDGTEGRAILSTALWILFVELFLQCSIFRWVHYTSASPPGTMSHARCDDIDGTSLLNGSKCLGVSWKERGKMMNEAVEQPKFVSSLEG